MEQMKSDIPLDYITIKTTQSRIAKGLLAIPASLINLFPKKKGWIFIENTDGICEKKTYTPYTSSSCECRIGGLKDFYSKYNLKNNDELVIQKIDDNTFRLLPEKDFRQKINDLLANFENSINENDADKCLKEVSLLSSLEQEDILRNEFVKLSNSKIPSRKIRHNTISSVSKAAVPLSIRKILLSLYRGKCQISGFTFLMKNNNPYFEVHHINPFEGNHPKNLLVVCPNVHAQFTHADSKQSFDDDGWLRSVKFNNEYFSVFQIIDTLKLNFKKEVHFTKRKKKFCRL
ncbi:MAG: HNH endonuclease [Elusimicrobiota bacterium]|jgi:hypothetical protein|nr:HNH endonuclease [Elusimicrobiota bacterium]